MNNNQTLPSLKVKLNNIQSMYAYRNAAYRNLKIAISSYKEYLTQKLYKQNALLAQIAFPEDAHSQADAYGLDPSLLVTSETQFIVNVEDEDMEAIVPYRIKVKDIEKIADEGVESLALVRDSAEEQLQQVSSGLVLEGVQEMIDDTQNQLAVFTYLENVDVNDKVNVDDLEKVYNNLGFRMTPTARETIESAGNMKSASELVKYQSQKIASNVKAMKNRGYLNLNSYTSGTGLGVLMSEFSEIMDVVKQGTDVIMEKVSSFASSMFKSVMTIIEPVLKIGKKLLDPYHTEIGYNMEALELPIFAAENIKGTDFRAFVRDLFNYKNSHPNDNRTNVFLNTQYFNSGDNSVGMIMRFFNTLEDYRTIVDKIEEEWLNSIKGISEQNRSERCLNYIFPTNFGYVEIVVHGKDFPTMTGEAYRSNMLGYDDSEATTYFSVYLYKGLWKYVSDQDDAGFISPLMYNHESMMYEINVDWNPFEEQLFESSCSAIDPSMDCTSYSGLKQALLNSVWEPEQIDGETRGYLVDVRSASFLSRIGRNEIAFPFTTVDNSEMLPKALIDSILEIRDAEDIIVEEPEYGLDNNVNRWIHAVGLLTGLPQVSLGVTLAKDSLYRSSVQNQLAVIPKRTNFHSKYDEWWLGDRKYDRLITPTGFKLSNNYGGEVVSVQQSILNILENNVSIVQSEEWYFETQNFQALYVLAWALSYLSSFIYEDVPCRVNGEIQFGENVPEIYYKEVVYDITPYVDPTEYHLQDGNILIYPSKIFQPYFHNTAPRFLLKMPTDMERGFKLAITIGAIIAAVVATTTIISMIRLKGKVKRWVVKKQAIATNKQLDLQKALNEQPVDKKKIAKLTKTSFKAQKKLNFATKIRDWIIGGVDKAEDNSPVQQAVSSRGNYPVGEYDLAFNLVNQGITGLLLEADDE